MFGISVSVSCESNLALLIFVSQLLLTFDPIIVEKVSILLLDMMVVSFTNAVLACVVGGCEEYILQGRLYNSLQQGDLC